MQATVQREREEGLCYLVKDVNDFPLSYQNNVKDRFICKSPMKHVTHRDTAACSRGTSLKERSGV